MIFLFWSYLSNFKSDFDKVKNNQFNVTNLNYSPIPAWLSLAQPQLVYTSLSLPIHIILSFYLIEQTSLYTWTHLAPFQVLRKAYQDFIQTQMDNQQMDEIWSILAEFQGSSKRTSSDLACSKISSQIRTGQVKIGQVQIFQIFYNIVKYCQIFYHSFQYHQISFNFVKYSLILSNVASWTISIL